MASRGEIEPDVMLFKDGSSRWVRAATLREFFAQPCDFPADDTNIVPPAVEDPPSRLMSPKPMETDPEWDPHPPQYRLAEFSNSAETVAAPDSDVAGLDLDEWKRNADPGSRPRFADYLMEAMPSDAVDTAPAYRASTMDLLASADDNSVPGDAPAVVEELTEAWPDDAMAAELQPAYVSRSYGKGLLAASLTLLLGASIVLGCLVGGTMDLSATKPAQPDVSSKSQSDGTPTQKELAGQ
jgi:hypothetical protein